MPIKWIFILLLLWSFPLFSMEREQETLQPGDQMRLRIVGVLDKLYDVGPEGNIDFDLWGKVNVRGMDHNQAVAEIKKRLSSFVRFGDKNIFLSIKKKMVADTEDSVSVFGEVRLPGAHPFRKHLKVLDYIVLSGGTTRFALTDSIKVICGQKKSLQVHPFNLQQFATGASTTVPPIHTGCLIYVPEKPADEASWLRNRPHQVIHIFGQVVKPGRYEFSEEFSFLDILSHVGGTTLQAETNNVSIISQQSVVHFDLAAYLKKGGVLPQVKTGDAIFVPERPKTNEGSWTQVTSQDSIYILGQVTSPGRYDFNNALNFMDILSQAGGPSDGADLSKVTIIAQGIPQQFDLERFLQDGGTLPLVQPTDIIYLPEKQSNSLKNWNLVDSKHSLLILGAVGKTGRYDFHETLGFMDFLAQSGGPLSNADLENVSIISQGHSMTFNFNDYLEFGGNLPTLQGGDVIYVPEIPKSRLESWTHLPSEKTIYIMGAVVRPGRYEFHGQLGFLDILAEAGGPTSTANIRKIKVLRHQKTVQVFNFYQFQRGNGRLPLLQQQDTIYVPQQNPENWVKDDPVSLISVMGEVVNPGRYEVESNNMNLLDILAAAKGPTKSADLSNIKIVRRTRFLDVKSNEPKTLIYHCDFEAFQETGDLNRLPVIRPGDIIILSPESLNFWEEFKTIGGALTVLGALALLL